MYFIFKNITGNFRNIYSLHHTRSIFIRKQTLKTNINIKKIKKKPQMKRNANQMDQIKSNTNTNNNNVNKKKKKRASAFATATLFEILHLSHSTSDYSKNSIIIRNSLTGKKYLFGSISEGFQRLVFQQNTGVQFSSFYLTGLLNWSSISGLPGCLITIADALEKMRLRISYPNNYLKFLLATTRHFILRKSINIDVDTNVVPKKEDGFTVVPIVTYPENIENGNVENDSFSSKELKQLDEIIAAVFKQISASDCEEGEQHIVEDNFGQISTEHQRLLSQLITKVNIKPQATSYHIKFDTIKGTFNVEKANELNIPNGKERGILSNGNSITLADGTLVTPDQVMGEKKSFSDILVLDIPDNTYLNNIKKKFLDNTETVDLKDTCLYYIFLSAEFEIDQFFINFLEDLKKQVDDKAKIFISHPKITPNEVVYEQFLFKILRKKKKLPNNYPVPHDNRVFSQRFFETYSNLKERIFNDKEIMLDETFDDNKNEILNNDKLEIFCSKDIVFNKATNISEDNGDCLTLNLNDRKEFGLEERINLHKSQNKSDVPLNEVFFKTLKSENVKEVEVMTLGTASACPGLNANVSGNLVKIPHEVLQTGETNVSFGVIDGGEGTINTMRRLFTNENMKKVFENLKFLYLSHLHADHHLGFISLIQEWYKFNSDKESAKLYVLCPSNFFRFLVEALATEPFILERIVGISCEEFKINKRTDIYDSPNFLYKGEIVSGNHSNLIDCFYGELKIAKIETVPAIHCNYSYSVSMTFKTRIGKEKNDQKVFKISYSGDTRPNHNFASKIGLNTDLLIHEATFPNELQDHAFKKKHSTVGEALRVADKMNCDNVVLTHFSQRTVDNIYKDIIPFVKNHSNSKKFTCIANDGLLVSTESLPECCEVDVNRAYKLMKRAKDLKSRDDSDIE